MNRTIKLLIISDVFLLAGFGLIQPILAIFIKENLIGGSIFAAGIAGCLILLALEKKNYKGKSSLLQYHHRRKITHKL